MMEEPKVEPERKEVTDAMDYAKALFKKEKVIASMQGEISKLKTDNEFMSGVIEAEKDMYSDMQAEINVLAAVLRGCVAPDRLLKTRQQLLRKHEQEKG